MLRSSDGARLRTDQETGEKAESPQQPLYGTVWLASIRVPQPDRNPVAPQGCGDLISAAPRLTPELDGAASLQPSPRARATAHGRLRNSARAQPRETLHQWMMADMDGVFCERLRT